MVDNLLEALGFLLLIAFSWFVWPPAVLLTTALILLIVANVRAGRAARRAALAKGQKPGPGLTERLVRAWLSTKADPR